MKKILSLCLSGALMLSITKAAAIPVNAQATSFATQEYTWKNVQIFGGGYVDNIVFNPGEEDLIYARTDMGGAYRWDKSNQIWIPLTDFVGWDDWNNLGIESLAVDPVNTNRVYMATGTYTNDWTDQNGYIFRSEDKGDTWEQIPLPFKNGANMLGRSMGERLVVDSNSPNILYFGTRGGNGLWRSTDYGQTWARMTTMPYVGTFKPTQYDATLYDDTLTGVVWVTPDPSTGSPGQPSQTIYIGVANQKGEDSIYVTHDAGTTWAPLAGQPKTIVTPDSNNPSVTKGLFPHHGVLASNGVMYIPYSDGLGPYDGAKGQVWKYDTTTGVWTNISPVDVNSGDNYYGYGGLAVDAQDPDTLIVATLNSWWPDANFFRSTDGGQTWTRFWDWDGYPGRTLRYNLDISKSPWLTFHTIPQPPEPQVKLGWMIGNIALDPFDSDRMFYGTGATVYGTTNLTDIDSGGKVNISVYAEGIEQIAAQDLISPPTGTAHLISGMYDVGGFVHTDLDTVPDQMISTPYMANTSFDYAELVPNKFVRVGNVDKGTNTRISLSYAGGSSWYGLNNAWQSNSEDTTGGGEVAMSADGESILWSPNGKPVYYSTNSGSSWALSTGIPQGAAIASDRANGNIFYGFAQNSFYVSRDKGKTFTVTATNLPQSGQIRGMHGVEGDIWLIGEGEEDGGLFHSTDGGLSFTKIEQVNQGSLVGFGKAASGETYMALYIMAQVDGVRGVFRSDDAGASWIRINDDDHQYGIANTSLIGDPRIYGRAYLATNGRGIFYADIAGEVSGPSNSGITPSTATFDKNPDIQANISVTVNYNGNTLTAVKNGSTALISGTDYTVSNNTVVISKTYLAGLPTGTVNLVFDFSAGADRTLAVQVIDSSQTGADAAITPTSASFDKNIANQEDISISVDYNGNTLTAVKNGSHTLVGGTDYTVSGDMVVIQKSYLAALATGTFSLNFEFNAGAPATLTLTVEDTTETGPVDTDLSVAFYNTVRSSTTNGVGFKYKLTNNSDTSIDLTDITLRYYFTREGNESQSFWCDWSHVGGSNVIGTFVNTASYSKYNNYLEISFASAAGALASGQSIELNCRFAKSNWSAYDQSNDYSFNSTADSYALWDKVTAYSNGTLISGIEP